MGSNCGTNIVQLNQNQNCEWGTCYSFFHRVNGCHRYDYEYISDISDSDISDKSDSDR